MDIISYQKEASRTCPSLGDEELDILHMDLGIATEVGELLDIFKKHIAYKKELDVVHIGEEIADICWYIVNKARITNIPLSENIEYGELNKYIHEKKDPFYVICDVLLYSILNFSYYDKFLSILKGIAKHFELNFEKLLENNINKLKVRYSEKFSEEKALNRDLDKERIELEK